MPRFEGTGLPSGGPRLGLYCLVTTKSHRLYSLLGQAALATVCSLWSCFCTISFSKWFGAPISIGNLDRSCAQTAQLADPG